MKEKDLRNSLVRLGKKKGMVTFEEINYIFPAGYCPLDELEGFLRRLDHLGVKVVDDRKKARLRAHPNRAA